MEGLGVVHHLLGDVIAGQDIEVHKAAQGCVRSGIVGAIDGIVYGLHLTLQICLLFCGERFRRLIGEPDGRVGVSVLKYRDMRVRVIVVYLHEPAAIHIGGGQVLLLHDIHAVLRDPYVLGQEVQAHVFAVHDQLHGLALGSPGHTQKPGEGEAGLVAQEAVGVIGMGEEDEVPAGGHTQDRRLFGEFKAIGFLLEAGPRVVAASLYLSGERLMGTAHGLYTGEPHRVKVICGVEIFLLLGDGFSSCRVYKQHGKGSAPGSGRLGTVSELYEHTVQVYRDGHFSLGRSDDIGGFVLSLKRNPAAGQNGCFGVKGACVELAPSVAGLTFDSRDFQLVGH